MIGGRYSLDREIGRGGMGAVYLGRDEVLHRQVALKKIGMAPGGSSPDLLRAEREARIAAILNHPHVVGVFDLVDDDDAPVAGHGVLRGDDARRPGARRRPARRRRRSPPIAAQVAEALAAAHEAGIVHRDVKPSNILVRDDGQVKISDFGIARAQADASLTQTGLVTGSPAYLAPEIASGQPATPAADAWSFGATLFHALAGHPPYDVGDNVLGALYRIVNEPPPRLESAGAMAPLLEATMTRDPADRWSMAEVLRFLHGLESWPRPRCPRRCPPRAASPTTRAPRCSRRRRPSRRPRRTRTAPRIPRRPRRPPRLPWTRPRPHDVASRCCPSSSVRSCSALVVAIVLLATLDDPQDAVTGPAVDGSSTPADSTSPTETEPTSAAPDAEAMAQFASDYVFTASDDPDAGFALLTPDYQAASGSYADFWGNVSDPEFLEGPTADPEALTVTYTYRYLFQGERKTETVTLQLTQDGDGYLIAGTV